MNNRKIETKSKLYADCLQHALIVAVLKQYFKYNTETIPKFQIRTKRLFNFNEFEMFYTTSLEGLKLVDEDGKYTALALNAVIRTLTTKNLKQFVNIVKNVDQDTFSINNIKFTFKNNIVKFC